MKSHNDKRGRRLISSVFRLNYSSRISRVLLLFEALIRTDLRKWADYTDAESFVIFIGYPRSGHSMIGSILSQHPMCVVSHELDVLRWFSWGFPVWLCERLVVLRDKQFSDLGRQWTGYNYKIRGGTYTSPTGLIKVIGDKRGGGTSERLVKNDSILAEFRSRILPRRLKLLHVVRNPFDNIATMAKKTRIRAYTLEQAIERYFKLASKNQEIIDSGMYDIITIYLEDFVSDPRGSCAALSEFLDVPFAESFHKAIEDMAFDSPRQTRDSVGWSKEESEAVMVKIKSIKFLNRYI